MVKEYLHGFVSLVIPLFNEEKNLLPLHAKLKEVLQAYQGNYEIIFVDDGSTDGSYAILEEISKKDENVKIVQLRGNQGKSSALEVGFQHAQGEIVITMDADLQDDPDDIPLFMEKLEEGFDLVSGWRRERRDDYLKRCSSFLFNKITSFITGVNLHDFNCGYKACRKDVLHQMELLPDFHRFIPVLAALHNYRVGEVKVHHHPRLEGHSKYGLARYPAGFFNLITIIFLRKYATKPLFFFGGIGLILFLLGFFLSSYLAFEWFRGYPIGHRPALLLGVLLIIVGIQLGSFGLLAELLLRHNRKKTESWIIKKKIGFDNQAPGIR